MMKIIWKDNFDRESVAERLVADNIQSDQEAEVMLKALRATCTNDGPDWYRLVKDDYKLWRGMAEFVED